jgi:hypothetical protein
MKRREFMLGFSAAVVVPMRTFGRAKPARLGYIWIGAKGLRALDARRAASRPP